LIFIWSVTSCVKVNILRILCRTWRRRQNRNRDFNTSLSELLLTLTALYMFLCTNNVMSLRS